MARLRSCGRPEPLLRDLDDHSPDGPPRAWPLVCEGVGVSFGSRGSGAQLAVALLAEEPLVAVGPL
jgi:hypothetical protein